MTQTPDAGGLGVLSDTQYALTITPDVGLFGPHLAERQRELLMQQTSFVPTHKPNHDADQVSGVIG